MTDPNRLAPGLPVLCRAPVGAPLEASGGPEIRAATRALYQLSDVPGGGDDRIRTNEERVTCAPGYQFPALSERDLRGVRERCVPEIKMTSGVISPKEVADCRRTRHTIQLLSKRVPSEFKSGCGDKVLCQLSYRPETWPGGI